MENKTKYALFRGGKADGIDKVAGARLDSWLKWLPEGGHPPVNLLTDEESKSEGRFVKGCHDRLYMILFETRYTPESFKLCPKRIVKTPKPKKKPEKSLFD